MGLAIQRKDFSAVASDVERVAGRNWRNVFGLLPTENVADAMSVYGFVLSLVGIGIAFVGLQSSESNKIIYINECVNCFVSSEFDEPQSDQSGSKKPPKSEKP